MQKKDFTIHPLSKRGPLFEWTEKDTFKDTKDPCIVYDGSKWHIFGSVGTVVTEEWKLLHAVSDSVDAGWKYQGKVEIIGTQVQGSHVAAPSVIFDEHDKRFHMFVQTDFMDISGTIEHLVSEDGNIFTRIGTALTPLPARVENPEGSPEAGLYDPHVSIVAGEKYIVYAGIPHPGEKKIGPRPDAFLARSETNTWDGPWQRVKTILEHKDIDWHHNQHDHPEYEWGIEGPQIVELPSGHVLLNATCFLPYGMFGTRQRVFFAMAENINSPFKSLGPVISHSFDPWESGENGHASAIVQEDKLFLFYQARSSENKEHPTKNNWNYGIATFDIDALEKEFRKN
jgi:hypothetical protein